MSVKKIKWTTLVSQIDAQDVFDDTEQEVEYIDNKINAFSQSYRAKALKELLEYVDDYLLKDNDICIWKDLNIYVSSFKEKDRRIILLIKNKIREYLMFYKKILTDDGIVRRMSYNKSYSNSGDANSSERGTNSETPQNSNLYDPAHPESDALFDQAIADYASGINKNKALSHSESEGESETIVSGTTWEEQKKNIQLLFFNELKEYIMSIPDIIYRWYAIDTMPYTEIIREYIKTTREWVEMLESDE